MGVTGWRGHLGARGKIMRPIVHTGHDPHPSRLSRRAAGGVVLAFLGLAGTGLVVGPVESDFVSAAETLLWGSLLKLTGALPACRNMFVIGAWQRRSRVGPGMRSIKLRPLT
jgi:hypothetical protein